MQQAQMDKIQVILDQELPTAALTVEELNLLAELKAIKAASALYVENRFEVKDSLLADIKLKLYFSETRPRKAPVQSLWVKMTAVAAIVAITLGTWLYYSNNTVLVNDVEPRKNRATLTMENGDTINLNNDKTGVMINSDQIAYDDGSSLEGEKKQIPVQMLTASTLSGSIYQVILPDGTHVWLNADSKISFPSQFSRKERKVFLSGEAYFEVTKVMRSSSEGQNIKTEYMPFIVISNNQHVEVLGTHFNIKSYAGEGAARTTLLEGSVRVVPGESVGDDTEGSVILKPNQQAILTGFKSIRIEPADVETITGWKNGDFVLSGMDLKSVMAEIARWYGVTVIYDISAPVDMKLDGWVSRKNNLSVVLRRIESLGNVHFKVEGRRIVVTK